MNVHIDITNKTTNDSGPYYNILIKTLSFPITGTLFHFTTKVAKRFTVRYGFSNRYETTTHVQYKRFIVDHR